LEGVVAQSSALGLLALTPAGTPLLPTTSTGTSRDIYSTWVDPTTGETYWVGGRRAWKVRHDLIFIFWTKRDLFPIFFAITSLKKV
jgi:hypothetical protein